MGDLFDCLTDKEKAKGKRKGIRKAKIENRIAKIIKMKKILVTCPNCKCKIEFKNWFVWIFYTPFHWFGKRKVKCSLCGCKNYVKKEIEK